MIHYSRILKIAIASFLFIQIVSASSSGLCLCSPTCGCSKDNLYNAMPMNPSCSCMNYQSVQNSLSPNNPWSYCNDQNCDMMNYQYNIGSCGKNSFSYNTQTPSNVPPMSRSSYSYAVDTPPVPCPQTYKNFGYQLQVPAAPQSEPNLGSFDGIIDKTYTKCPVCKPVH